MIKTSSDEATMLKGTSRHIMLPVDRKTGLLVDPLETWEKDYLEEVLGLNLNIYSKDANGYYNCFYTNPRTSGLTFSKEGTKLETASMTLDLGNPLEFLKYKIAMAHPKVASKWSERSDIRKEFVVTDNASELAEDTAHNDKEDEVLAYLLQIKTNKKALFDLIRLYGTSTKNKLRASKDANVEYLYNELKKESKTLKGIRALYDIITMQKSSPRKLNTMILIEDGITCGELERRGNEIRLPSGAVIGYNITEAIAFLEDIENQTNRLKLQTKVNQFNESL